MRAQDESGATAAAKNEAARAAVVAATEEEEALVAGQTAGRIGVGHPHDLGVLCMTRGGRGWSGRTCELSVSGKFAR